MSKFSTYIFLLLFGLLYMLPGLGHLEFFRHTEADRTLIGWEMLQTHEYLVPHLLGRVILTKPPLFYWLIAASIHLVGAPTEFAARLPSALAALLALFTQFLVLRRVGLDRAQALIGTLLFATGIQFFVQSTLAEIDMCFAWLSSTAMFLAFLGILERKFLLTLLAYFFLALAFLTKGPPALFFFVAIIPLCILLSWREDPAARRAWGKTIAQHLCGAVFFAAIVGTWLYTLASHVGWTVLTEEFRVEVVNRVVAESSRGRGVLFYVGTVLLNLAPWSVFALAALIRSRSESRAELTARMRAVPGRMFFVFNLVGLLVGTLMLTIAAGKSSRYFFPLYPLAANVCIWLAYGVTEFFAVKNIRRALVSLVLFALATRGLYVSLYVPIRNESRSVKPLVAILEQELRPDETLYLDGMWERWIAYYLKRDGRQVAALTPQLLPTLPLRVKLLLSPKDEPSRMQAVLAAPSYKELRRFTVGSDELVLLEISSNEIAAR